MKVVDIISTSRADYDLVTPLFEELARPHSKYPIQVRLILAGTHTNAHFGHHNVSFPKNKGGSSAVIRLPQSLSKDINEHEAVLSVANQQYAYETFVHQTKVPDAIVLLGDRYELMAFATISVIRRTLLVHCHGGEVTNGAIDDKIRNAVSMLSDIHLVSTKLSQSRLASMEISQKSIHVVGPFALDHLRHCPSIDKEQLILHLGFSSKLISEFALVTLHSETRFPHNNKKNIKITRFVIDRIYHSQRNFGFVITGPNADPGSQELWNAITEAYSGDTRFNFVKNLGYPLYTQALKHSKLLIGNSSSGIIEAPLVGLPVINVGLRQGNRERLGLVYDVCTLKQAERLPLKRLCARRSGIRSNVKASYFRPAKTSASLIRSYLYKKVRVKT